MSHLQSLAAAALLCAGAATSVQGDPARSSSKDRFIGTWTLVSIHYVRPDGTRVEPFGPNAKGILTFDRTHFATQIMAADRPKFVSNNRMIGTAEEFKAASQGVVAYFGTYTIRETESIVTLHIERASFPNWDGTDQLRKFTVSTDELRYTAAHSTANPAEAAELVWKRSR